MVTAELQRAAQWVAQSSTWSGLTLEEQEARTSYTKLPTSTSSVMNDFLPTTSTGVLVGNSYELLVKLAAVPLSARPPGQVVPNPFASSNLRIYLIRLATGNELSIFLRGRTATLHFLFSTSTKLTRKQLKHLFFNPDSDNSIINLKIAIKLHNVSIL